MYFKNLRDKMELLDKSKYYNFEQKVEFAYCVEFGHLNGTVKLLWCGYKDVYMRKF
jgi:hypothetical protein